MKDLFAQAPPSAANQEAAELLAAISAVRRTARQAVRKAWHEEPLPIAHQIGSLPPVGSLFAAFLGYNPVHTLLAPTGVLAHLPASHVATLTGKRFFPELISGPFHDGLVIVFSMAMAVLVIAAGISLLRGGRYVHDEHAVPLPESAPSANGRVCGQGSRAAS